MALQFACVRLVEDEDLNCDCKTDGLQFGDMEEILDAASDILVLITGLPFGRCERSIRPCQRNMVCGGACGCCELTGIPLIGPDPEVTEVLIDGVEVDPNTYAVLVSPGGDRILERFKLDGKPDYWPGCQRLALASTEVGTFEVTYLSGLLINALVKNAAAEIACDLVSAASGGNSALPDGTVALSVYGIQIDRRRFGDPTENDTQGLAGLSWTQRIMSTYPRASLTTVWSPELPGAEWSVYQR